MTRKKLSAPRFTEVMTGDGSTEVIDTHSREGQRVTIDGTIDGGGATVQVMGSYNGTSFYNLGDPFVVAPGDTRSLWIGEPNTVLRVDLTGVAGGDVSVIVQELA